MAIKKDDVFRVADEMFADGVSPSLIAIRSKLGSGSFSTISGFLAEWKSSSRSLPVVGLDEVPHEIQEVFAPALRSMWAVAQIQAKEVSDKLQFDCAAQLSAAAGREIEALALAQVLQDEIEAYSLKLISHQAVIDGKDEQIMMLQAAYADSKAREEETRNSHLSLLAKIRPISLRKDRGVVPGLKSAR